LLRNPRAQGYRWFAPVEQNKFMFANLDDLVENNESVIQINYRATEKELNNHKEWYLMAEGRESSTVKTQHWNKLIDSLCGSTADITTSEMPELERLSGAVQVNSNSYFLTVPDPALSQQERTGNQFRPRQSFFDNVHQARRVFVQAANELLADVNLVNSGLNPSRTIRSQNYWTRSTWYATGYSAENTEPKFIVPDVGVITATGAVNGDFVRVEPVNNSAFIVLVGTGIVAIEDSIIQILDRLYTDVRTTKIRTELREIFEFLDLLFVNDLTVRKNKLFFAMTNYVLSEQPDVDWIFKTTYISIRQDGVELSQTPTLTNDPFDSFIEYVNEVKPYSTKVRDYRNSFGTQEDTNVNINDSLYQTNLRLVFNRTEPTPVNVVVDSASFSTGWESTGWDLLPWDNEEVDQTYVGTNFVEANSVPPVSSETISGADFTVESLSDTTSRSFALIPVTLTDLGNIAIFKDNEQVLDYYIVGNTVVFTRAVAPEEEFVLFEYAPLDAGNFLQPANTVGSAQELIPLAPRENVVFTVNTQGLKYRLQVTPDRQMIIERMLDIGAELAQELLPTDLEIVLNDASALPPATQTNREVVWVAGERITYAGKVGNTLVGLQRGTRSTPVQTYATGTLVVYGGDTEALPAPARDQAEWVNSNSITTSTTPEANFLLGN
jgi:hypothetical protein